MKRQTRMVCTAILAGIAGIIACSDSTAPDSDTIRRVQVGPSSLTFGNPEATFPGGASVSFFGDPLRAGGKTTQYSAYDLSGFTYLLWGNNTNASVQLALDGAVDDASETLSFASTSADLLNSTLIWTGQSTITYTAGGVSHTDMVATRLIATSATSGGIDAANLQPYGIPPSIGGAFEVFPGTFETNVIFEVQHDNVWTPALDLFEQLGISDVSQIVSQFTPAFYALYGGPHLSANATAHNFGSVYLGATSSDADITLQNNSQVTTTVSAADVAGANPGDFAVVNNTCAAVAVDATCTVTIHFAPTIAGARNASLVISGDFLSFAIQLSGTGVQGTAAVDASPTGLDFGPRNVGTATTLRLTITNTGTAAFGRSGFTIGGTDPSDFLIFSHTCPTSLPVGASCDLNVRYTPTDVGSRSATLSITGNAPTFTVPLTGGGVALAAIASPNQTSLAFASFNVGATSPALTFVIANTGNAPLVISVLNMLGANPLDFSASGCIGQTLAPVPAGGTQGGFCTVTVRFSPKDDGPRSAQLSIVSNAEPASVALTGTGNPVFPTMLTDPAPFSGLNFGQVLVGGGSVALPITIGNQGNGDLVLNSASIANGAFFLDYALSGSCGPFPSIVVPGARCQLLVTFDPIAAGTRNATLSLSTNNGSPSFNLTGVGVGTPAINASSADIEFGSKDVGSITTIPLTITNTGTAAFIHGDFTIGGADPGDFVVFSHNCPTSLPIFANCTLNVRFSPTGIGSRAANLSVTGNAPTVTVLLGGTGLAPIATPNLASIAFTPNVNVGSTSGPRNFTITNTGNTTLVIEVFNMLGANPLDFNTTGCIGATLSPNGICTVNVTFSPKDDGLRSAQLSIVSNGAPASVALSGTGNPIFPQLVVDPTNSNLNFNQVVIGGGRTTLPILIGNTGLGDLVINSALIASGPAFLDYSLSGDCPPFPSVVPTRGQCTLLVTFDPTTAGTRNSTLTISTNGGSRIFNLTGVGVNPTPQIQLSPNFLNFGSVLAGGNGATLSVTISNAGTANLQINSASITGVAAAEYTLSGSCTPSPAVVTPGTNCVLLVTFDPTAAGTRNASIGLSTNAGPQNIGLTGVGQIPAPIIRLSTGSADFPDTQVGATSFSSTPPNITVTNMGNANLVISSINFTGSNASEFAVRSQSCTFGSLPPNASCTFDLGFSPAATGSRSAQVFLSANASSGPVQLTGTGVGQPSIGVSPASLGYSARQIGTSSPSQAITISSTGNLPLHLSNVTLGGTSPGDYAITGNTCPAAIAPNTGCTISVSFSPTAGGNRLAILTVSSDANIPAPPVNLSGVALSPADLAASVSANPIAGKAGRPLTYNIGITNYGPAAATDLVITDALPASTTFASFAAPVGVSCTTPLTGNAGTVVCRRSSLSSGVSFSISITVNLLAGGKASISNTVNVSASTADPTAANNSATVATTISGRK